MCIYMCARAPVSALHYRAFDSFFPTLGIFSLYLSRILENPSMKFFSLLFLLQFYLKRGEGVRCYSGERGWKGGGVEESI